MNPQLKEFQKELEAQESYISENDIMKFNLIAEVRRHPCLYDKKDPNYRNRLWIAEAWEDIAETIEWTPKECMSTYAIMRTQFRALMKEKSSSGADADEGEGIRWSFYHCMIFLKPHIGSYRKKEPSANAEPKIKKTVEKKVCIICAELGKLNIKPPEIESLLNPKFYNFPTNLHTKSAWDRQIKRAFPHLNPPFQGTICELHFSEDDVDYNHNKLLMRGAVPYINADTMNELTIARNKNKPKPVGKFGNNSNVDLYFKSIDLHLDLNTVCRVCLLPAVEDGRLMTEGEKDTVWKAGYLLNDDPNFPDHICQSCSADLTDDLNFNFRMNYDSSSAILEQYLQHIRKNAPSAQGGAHLLWLEGFHAKIIAKEIIVHPRPESPKNKPVQDTVRFEDFDYTLDEDIEQQISSVLPIIEEVEAQSKTSRASTCEYCGDTYPSREALRHHINRRHLKNFKFPCDRCDKKFYRNYELLLHIKRVHLSKRRILRRSNVPKTIYKKEKQSCQYCTKIIDKCEMTYHVQRHFNIKPFKCDLCSGAFVRSAELTAHVLSRHEVSPDGYICSYCEKSFDKLMTYKTHVMHQHPEVRDAPFGCSVCSKEFLFAWSLNKHKSSHNNVKPVYTGNYICHECGKELRSKCTLRRHLKMHKRHNELLGDIDYSVQID